MTKRALVSVCIPAYSNPELLERLLKSILAQSYRPIEINVVDDCSPIDLSEICKQFSKEDENEILNLAKQLEEEMTQVYLY